MVYDSQSHQEHSHVSSSKDQVDLAAGRWITSRSGRETWKVDIIFFMLDNDLR